MRCLFVTSCCLCWGDGRPSVTNGKVVIRLVMGTVEHSGTERSRKKMTVMRHRHLRPIPLWIRAAVSTRVRAHSSEPSPDIDLTTLRGCGMAVGLVQR